jgi:hypothetical protein
MYQMVCDFHHIQSDHQPLNQQAGPTMNFLKTATASVALCVAGLAHAALPAGSIFVTEPGADGFTTQTMGFNGSSYTISKITFDFTPTTTLDGGKIVIDGSPFGVTAPAGGTATFFGSGSVFGFNFTSFDTFDIFSFGWDPDSTLSGNYGATSLDFIGAKVTAVTSNGLYVGSFERVGTTLDVAASLSPVPESQTLALALAGVMTLGFLGRQKRMF